MISQLKSKDGRVVLDLGEDQARLSVEGDLLVGLPVLHVDTLTLDRATEFIRATDARAESGGLLVSFERSSPQAREALREAGLSYAGSSGELYLHAPPVHVEWPASKRETLWGRTAPTSPFAIRASRVPRWLLLNPGEEPTFKEISAALDLSESIVSRTIRSLAGEGLVAVAVDERDARRRRVRLRDAGALLDAFERANAVRQIRRQVWDIGARGVEPALDRLHRAATRASLSYTVSGLAGAALVRRVVEPAAVEVWLARADVDRLAQELEAVASRPGPARLTLNIAPDPFVLGLGEDRDGVHVADPVQLYLDCRRAGERALEAAEAIREEMRW